MTETEQTSALAREDLCRYLAACYYEPESAMAEEDLFGSLAGAAARIDDHLAAKAQSVAEAFRAVPMVELLVDYTRLFLGPTEILASPYGSVWLDEARTLAGESTMAVSELYREADFEMDESFRDLPDHIAVELEFLYLMIFRGNEAAVAADAELARKSANLKHRFLTEHLGQWVAPFADSIRRHARTRFYSELADLTEAFIWREREASAGEGDARLQVN